MKRQQSIRRFALALALAALAAAPLVAQAGALDRWFKKGKSEQSTTARFDREPPQVFDGGALNIDASGRWRLGGSTLVFTGETLVLEGDRPSDSRRLRMGQEARLTGYRLADGTIAVRRLRVFTSRQMLSTSLGSTLRPVGVAPAGQPR